MRVATLNVWALPEPWAKDVAPRIKAIGDRLASLDVDVVAFEEVFRADARATLIEAGRRAGLVHAWHGSSLFGGGGLLTLSRLPIEGARFERYSLRGQVEEVQTGEYLSGKGFATLQLRTSEGPVSFISTHLHARHSSDFPHEFQAHRIAQIVQLSLASTLSKYPMVVAGDFNFTEDHPEYAIFKGLTGLGDAVAELDLRVPTVDASNPYRGAKQHPKRIDFVFRRDGVSSSVSARHAERIFDDPVPLRGRRGAFSNHAGVLVEVDVEQTGETPLPRPLAQAVREASRLLAEGRASAQERRRDMRALSGVGLASVVAATAAVRSPKMSRRSLLRLSLRGAALAALTPTVGYSMLSEVFVPSEIHAFEDAQAELARLGDEVALRNA
jgi:endonuclease/exonuclease/phosphatase family metal-dependent hydrolase